MKVAGVKIQFLSLYPKEVEYVYPPLTFLSVVDKPKTEATRIGNVKIVEVIPQMSWLGDEELLIRI